jgi:hypothetical protein
VLGRPVSAGLEELILRCLAKDAGERPAHAGELLALFEACEVKGHWGQPEARAWWASWRERHPEGQEESEDAPSTPSGYTIDLRARANRS